MEPHPGGAVTNGQNDLRAATPYDTLFEGRILFIGAPLDDGHANAVIPQLLYLEWDDPARDTSLYLNSPGGSLTAISAVYDTLSFIRCDVSTYCLGQAGPAATALLAAGTPDERAAAPHARVSIHQPSAGAVSGHHSDVTAHAEEISRRRRQLEAALAALTAHTGQTGQTEERIGHDLDRERIFTSAQALGYGLIDHILTSRKRPR